MLLLIHFARHQWHKATNGRGGRKFYQQQWHLHHLARLNKLLREENASWKFIATQVSSLLLPRYLINISYSSDNQFSTQQWIFLSLGAAINSNEVNKWFLRGKFSVFIIIIFNYSDSLPLFANAMPQNTALTTRTTIITPTKCRNFPL